MTFSEAVKANETSAVVSSVGQKFDIGTLVSEVNDNVYFRGTDLTGTWTLVREPRVIWVNEYGGQFVGSVPHLTKEAAKFNADISHDDVRTLKFVEVLGGLDE